MAAIFKVQVPVVQAVKFNLNIFIENIKQKIIGNEDIHEMLGSGGNEISPQIFTELLHEYELYVYHVSNQ